MGRVTLRPKYFIILLFAIVVVWFVTLLYAYLRTSAQTSQAITFVTTEYSLIKPLAGATLIADGVSRKERIIEAAYHFDTKLPFIDVRSHYDAELTRLGWSFLRESAYPFAHDVDYCKGKFGAKLTYDLTGRYNWKYTLYLSWAEYGCSP